MHNLILGITGTGKTTLAFTLARYSKENGYPRIILDPDLRSEWQAEKDYDFITSDPSKFLAFAQQNKSCSLFIDEAGQTIGRYSGEMMWVATNSRKWGHKAYFISQRATQLDPTVRTQCTGIYLFQQSVNDCKILANEFNRPQLMYACDLRKGEYLCKLDVDAPIKKGKAW